MIQNFMINKLIDRHEADWSILGVLGGMMVGVGALASVIASAELTLVIGGFGKVIGAAIFPIGLIMILWFRFELFTSDMLCLSARDRRESIFSFQSISYFIFIVWLFNMIGAALFGIISVNIGITTPLIEKYLTSIAIAKMNSSAISLFTKGILCNVFVCLAAVVGLRRNALLAWIPVFIFVLCGFEHSVANMFYFGCAIGANTIKVLSFKFISSIVIVSIGNVVGGIIIFKLLKYIEGGSRWER